MRNLFFLFSALVIFSACKNLKLSASTLAWNPYTLNQELVFKSDQGAEQTFKVSTLDQTSNRINPYGGIFSGKTEQLFVLYNVVGSNTEEQAIFAMARTSEGGTILNFILQVEGVIHSSDPMPIADAEAMPETTQSIQGKIYSDVLIITPPDPGANLTFPKMKKLYWSKAKGFVRYELSDGRIWELVD